MKPTTPAAKVLPFSETKEGDLIEYAGEIFRVCKIKWENKTWQSEFPSCSMTLERIDP